ncbi:uncharacterized protein LOC125076228 [Vanessa atalanta]|uniref:uncharacterized protein LOC125076228 n=1 Tax=Vanessa atalanta TaxID=42275 RepID=UPI001FCD6460|nr:uncharacterized protein LOC125076228 [Vanessa atalanta]
MKPLVCNLLERSGQLVNGITGDVNGKSCVVEHRQVRLRLGLATFPAKVTECQIDLSHFVTQRAPLNKLTSFTSSTVMLLLRATCMLLVVAASMGRPYDPEDGEIKSVLPSSGEFEAFYPRQAHGIPNGSSRPAHGHGSFYKHRNPALVDVKNAAAYGFRFDGMRRFNFDDDEE